MGSKHKTFRSVSQFSFTKHGSGLVLALSDPGFTFFLQIRAALNHTYFLPAWAFSWLLSYKNSEWAKNFSNGADPTCMIVIIGSIRLLQKSVKWARPIIFYKEIQIFINRHYSIIKIIFKESEYISRQTTTTTKNNNVQ